jgi:hypothetical protein
VYLIADLEAMTGFSRRTIRFYVVKGYIDGPVGRGPYAYYGNEQLEWLTQRRGTMGGNTETVVERQKPRRAPVSSRETIARMVTLTPLEWRMVVTVLTEAGGPWRELGNHLEKIVWPKEEGGSATPA